MREIKFRAWNKIIKKFLHFDNPTGISDGEDRYGVFFPAIERKMYFGEMELMQYTGLQDKHGKEIYEGDILRQIYNEGDGEVEDDGFQHPSYTYFICEYVDEIASFVFKKFKWHDTSLKFKEKYNPMPRKQIILQENRNENLWEREFMLEYDSNYEEYSEVIGNIYENHELLEESI